MNFLVVKLTADEQRLGKAVLTAAFDWDVHEHQLYFRVLDTWTEVLLRKHDIPLASQRAWAVRETDMLLGPLPEDIQVRVL